MEQVEIERRIQESKARQKAKQPTLPQTLKTDKDKRFYLLRDILRSEELSDIDATVVLSPNPSNFTREALYEQNFKIGIAFRSAKDTLDRQAGRRAALEVMEVGRGEHGPSLFQFKKSHLLTPSEQLILKAVQELFKLDPIPKWVNISKEVLEEEVGLLEEETSNLQSLISGYKEILNRKTGSLRIISAYLDSIS